MTEKEVKSILIIGISGGLSQITAKLLSKRYPDCSILGVDARKVKHLKSIPGVKFQRMHYSRGQFEKLFRSNKFDVVYHLGRVSHTSNNSTLNLKKRLNLNVLGTQKILDLCLQHEVKKVVILSTFHVYGALPDNPIFINENSPLKASLNYPELRDVVEMDRLSTNWMWQHKGKLETIVLRPCNIIGPHLNNSMTKFLTSKLGPTPMDFNPMFQFINEFDMGMILRECLEKVPAGIYNIAPDDYISIEKAKEIAGGKSYKIPLSIVGFVGKLIKKSFPTIPDYLLDYLMYSCLISNKEIKKYLGDDFVRFKVEETLQLINHSD